MDQHLIDTLKPFFILGVDEVKSKDEKDEFLEWLLSNASSNDDRELYFRVHYWRNMGTVTADAIAERYKLLYQKKIVLITESELRPMLADVRRRYRIQEREHRESKASLIEISLKDMNLLLPWFSLLIVVSGYFYTSILYGKLGIDYDQFYSVGDHISSSVNQLPHALGKV